MASLSDFRKRINSVGSKKQASEPIPAVTSLTPATGPYTPSLPGVNLLPSIFAERQANRSLIRRFVWAGAVVVLVLAVLFGLSFAVKFFQASQLTTLQANAANYNRQIQALQPYESYKTSIANERTTLGNALQTDIDMAKILSTLNTQASNYGVKYSNIGLTLGNGNCIQDPFQAAPTIGCITLSGTAPSQSGVSNFFNTLNGTSGFLNAVPASLSAGTGATYSFNGSVSFNQGFYSKKYVNLTSDLNQLLSTGSGSDTGTTPLATLLKSRYPTVFNQASVAQITTFGQQVCAFTASPITSATLNTRVVAYGQTVQLSIPTQQANAITNDVISTNCSSNSKNITGGIQ